MRKYLILAVIAVFVAALSPVAALAGQEKLTVCHLEGNDTFHLIEVAEPAYYNALIAHGDLLPGEAVPDMPGYVFDDMCQAVASLAVTVDVYFQNGIGYSTASALGLSYEFGGEIYLDTSLVYLEEYWGTYLFYLPRNELQNVAEVNIVGVPQELTLVFDVFKLNLDGTLGGYIAGASFQHSFLPMEGTTASVIPGGVWFPGDDPFDPEWFITPDDGVCGLHLGHARVYLGSTASGVPIATGEAIAVMCS